jgi:hypothetical protein
LRLAERECGGGEMIAEKDEAARSSEARRY